MGACACARKPLRASARQPHASTSWLLGVSETRCHGAPQVCTLSSLLPLPLLGLVPNSSGAEEVQNATKRGAEGLDEE